jgi:hypothetical protein
VATSAQLAPTRTVASPLALWHLLSLDAPTVAALWTWFVARANHIRLPLTSTAAMALAVWVLYAADRLLDSRLLDVCPRSGRMHYELEARHYFHHRHRRAFLIGVAIAAAVLAALLRNLPAATIHLYLVEGALLFAWFLVLHATHSAHRLPKEIAVGLFFAAATFIPTVSREPFAANPTLRLTLVAAALLFAALCSLNCLFIYAWEHEAPGPAPRRRPHPTTRLALRHLATLAIGIAVAAAALMLFKRLAPWPIAVACSLSALLLLLLDRNRHQLPQITLRAAADLALLTPLALLPFLR